MVSLVISSSQYVGNASAVTPYPTGFYFLDNAHVYVRVVDEDGIVTDLENGVDFTVTGARDSDGGDVVTTDAIPATSTVTVYRRIPLNQLLDLTYTGQIPAQLLEDALDKLVLIMQEVGAGRIGPVKALTFPIGEDDSFLTELPAAPERLNKFLHFNALTGEMELITNPTEEAAAEAAISAAASEVSRLAAVASAVAAAASAVAADASADAAAASAVAADASADAAAISAAEASAITVPNDSVTNAKLANMAEATIKGRAVGAGTGDPTDLTGAQAKSVIIPTGVLDTDIGNGIISVNTDPGSVSTFTLADGGTIILPHCTLTMPVSPLRGMEVGTVMVWDIFLSKTASNTGNFRIKIFRGLTGVWSTDTEDASATIGVQTAVADLMRFRVTLRVTTTGAAGAYAWHIDAMQKADSATGFGLVTGAGSMFTGPVSGVALNTANLKFSIGIQSFSGGGPGASFRVGSVLAQAFRVC